MVTQEFIDQLPDESYFVEGIPKGLSFFRKVGVKIGANYKVGNLVAFKIGKKDMAYAPVVHDIGATEEEIAREYKDAEQRLKEQYKKL